MPALTTSLVAVAAAFTGLSTIYGFFCSKSTDDNRPGSGSSGSASTSQQWRPPPPPPSSNSRSQTTTRTPTSSSDHTHNRNSYYNWNHTVTSTTRTADSRPAPSASTHAQPAYQQPVYPRAAQATAQTKENLESSGQVHRHTPSSSRQTLPTSTTQSHVPPSAHSTRFESQADRIAYLNKLRANLSSYHAAESRQTPTTSTSRAQVPHPTQSTPSRVGKTTSTSDHLDQWAGLTSSHAQESRRTPSTSAAHAQAPQLTPSRVGKTPSRASDHLDPFDPWDGLASSPTRESRLAPSASARTQASYLGQQTTPRVGQTTLRTPTIAEYDGGIRRSGLTSRDAEEPRVVYPDSPMMSPYSYLRPPSPDAPRARVSRLTASPKKHSRTQSSSSDSDYLGPSSPAVPRSRTPLSDQSDPFDDAVENAESNKKAGELREKARRSNREMRDARDRAKSARKRGDRMTESECNQEARAHESAMKNRNKTAAKIIFRAKNQGQEEGTVDLHGLYVPEAVEYAKEELQSAMYRDDNTVGFIVGKGLHAEDGVSKLRPALEELFDERGLRHTLDPGNSGKLIVYLY